MLLLHTEVFFTELLCGLSQNFKECLEYVSCMHEDHDWSF